MPAMLRATRRFGSLVRRSPGHEGLKVTNGIAWQKHTPKVVSPQSVPLLLIHGFGCGRDDWGALTHIVASKSKREVISFDNRGIGSSDASKGPYTVEMMAADALSVIEAASFQKVDVLGISLGGMIAQEFALKYPERTNGLVLGCTTHGGRHATPVPDSFISICAAFAGADDPNTSPVVDDFLAQSLPADCSRSAFFEKLKSRFSQTPRTARGLQGQLGAMSRFNVASQLGTLTCPTLVVAGMRRGSLTNALARTQSPGTLADAVRFSGR